MRVLFIYPDLNIDIGWKGQYYEGIASLSAILKSKGHYVELSHIYNLQQSKTLIEQISQGFDLIAFSSTTTMFPFVRHCSKIIKKRFKNIPMIYGGSHPTSVPRETLQNSDIDYVCVGEGEGFILDFLEYLKGSRTKDEIKNLAYKNGVKEIVINELRPPIDPLDDLPFPDRELFAPHINSNFACMSAGRGCPFQCAYCSNNNLNKIYKNKYLRFRKPETVISEIELLLKKFPSIRELAFLDDVFTINEGWLAEFCKLYGNLFDVPFRALAHPAAITDSKIKALKAAGCFEINFGIQSGNEFIRKGIMRRPGSNNKIKESVNILKKNGMKPLADIIFGVPMEEKIHMLDTIKICAENGVEAKSHIFYPLPATRLEQVAIENNLHERNSYGEDITSRTILGFSKLHKARVLFFHRYAKCLILIYRIFACSSTKIISKKNRFYILDKTLCSDFIIYFIITLRSVFISLRSFMRKIFGISEYRVTQLKDIEL
jgi:radical SAM superfamily enzyme YgiQ (UPF0313 family)